MKRYTLPSVLLAVWACFFVGLADAGAQTLTPRYGGILRMFGFDSYCIGYPPNMTAQTDGQTSSVALESLFRFDEKAEIVPLLALGWRADVKAKTITITLRKGVKFHDGTDFNAKACKWNLDKFREAEEDRPHPCGVGRRARRRDGAPQPLRVRQRGHQPARLRRGSHDLARPPSTSTARHGARRTPWARAPGSS